MKLARENTAYPHKVYRSLPANPLIYSPSPKRGARLGTAHPGKAVSRAASPSLLDDARPKAKERQRPRRQTGNYGKAGEISSSFIINKAIINKTTVLSDTGNSAAAALVNSPLALSNMLPREGEFSKNEPSFPATSA